MILLDRVTKTYSKDATPAVNRMSLFIEPREFVVVIGSSGAGKSTLLKLLTREEKPTSGKIVVGGIDYDTLKDSQIPMLRRKIGVVFQDFKLLPPGTVMLTMDQPYFLGRQVAYSNPERAWDCSKLPVRLVHFRFDLYPLVFHQYEVDPRRPQSDWISRVTV